MISLCLTVAAIVVAAAVLTELAHGLASRARLAPLRADSAASEAIIVLGYPSRSGNRIHPIQRWRCQIAARSMRPGRSSVLIMTGAAKPGVYSEAAVMAAYARDALGVPARQIVLEERAKTTWENMAFSLPLAERFAAIKIASDPLHARRAHRYIAQIRPELVARLEPAASYRPGEHLVLKAGTLAYEARLAIRHRLATMRPPQRDHLPASQAYQVQETGHDPNPRKA